LVSLTEDEDEFEATLVNRYIEDSEDYKENFWLEVMKDEYAKKFNELDKRIFAMKKILSKSRTNVDVVEYAKNMYKAYTLEKPRFIIDRIREIEYPIYNTLYSQNGKDYKGVGDSLYESIRDVFDLASSKSYKITSKALQHTVEEFLIKDGATFLDGKWVNRKGKKIRVSSKLNEVKDTIDKIYNVSDKGYLSSLKVVG